MHMKSFSSITSCCLVAAMLGACSSANTTSSQQSQSGTTFCFNCHSETSDLGKKILWAQAGYATSVHSQGQVARIYSQVVAGGCPPFVPATPANCTAQNGTLSKVGNVCTMPLASTTQAECLAAGGTWFPAVADATTANSQTPGTPGAVAPPSGPCPGFKQALAAAGAAQACTVAGGTFSAGALTCDTTALTSQNACETAGGVWVGPRWELTGEEHEGSNAFYANSGGCQMCHTHEGYRKRISGQYDVAGAYSIQFSWDTRAQVGSPTSTPNTPLTADTIEFPSPIGCFTCHTPHGIGTTDNESLDQSVPEGTAITTQTGAIWGNATTGQNKAKGHICAECHQIRLNNQPSTSASILASVTGSSGKFSVSGPYGPHHGPQTDMILGHGGAQYGGTAGTFAFAGTYGNSPHTTNVNADCVSCHMQSDVEDINVTGRLGVSAAVGGHAFTNKGFVHGGEQVLALGCGSVTNGVGCHTTSGVSGSTGTLVAPANFAQTVGYLQAGDAYFQKSTNPDGKTMTDANYQFKVNELLTKLANPSASCAGLLQSAAVAAGGGGINWAFLSGGTVDPRCIFNGTFTGIAKAAAPADDNTNASVRFLKALWNFKFVLVEDKSFGVHNTTYALQLLYDSCTDLTLLTGGSCGAVAGRCSACEGTFVTTRP
jgi:hypothetical protein